MNLLPLSCVSSKRVWRVANSEAHPQQSTPNRSNGSIQAYDWFFIVANSASDFRGRRKVFILIRIAVLATAWCYTRRRYRHWMQLLWRQKRRLGAHHQLRAEYHYGSNNTNNAIKQLLQKFERVSGWQLWVTSSVKCRGLVLWVRGSISEFRNCLTDSGS